MGAPGANAARRDFAATWRARQRRNGYDCIVIGGGHNGLVCAAYLARSGPGGGAGAGSGRTRWGVRRSRGSLRPAFGFEPAPTAAPDAGIADQVAGWMHAAIKLRPAAQVCRPSPSPRVRSRCRSTRRTRRRWRRRPAPLTPLRCPPIARACDAAGARPLSGARQLYRRDWATDSWQGRSVRGFGIGWRTRGSGVPRHARTAAHRRACACRTCWTNTSRIRCSRARSHSMRCSASNARAAIPGQRVHTVVLPRGGGGVQTCHLAGAARGRTRGAHRGARPGGDRRGSRAALCCARRASDRDGGQRGGCRSGNSARGWRRAVWSRAPIHGPPSCGCSARSIWMPDSYAVLRIFALEA